MKTYKKPMAVVSGLVVFLGFSGASLAEEREQHKHYKATMPEESHQAYIEKNFEKNTLEESSESTEKSHHKHYKVTMPGESHNAYAEKTKENRAHETEIKTETHKHYKATMNGEKHGK